ncbi:TPA: SAVED domain-containing protein [Stenotrophomonas maltophilia]
MLNAAPNSSNAPPGSAVAVPIVAPSVPALHDSELALEFERTANGTGDVLVVANAFTVLVLERPNDTAPWSSTASGDFGSKCQAAVRRLRGRLYWASVDDDPLTADIATIDEKVSTPAFIKGWLKKASLVTASGRRGDINSTQKEELGYQAGWRCQFAGCGQDLRWHEATATIGRFGYFAHIVASSPDGPRGDPVESARLASDPTNILLLCDACHRRIDKVEPQSYPTDVLRKMREDNIAAVKRLLDTLRYPDVSVLCVTGNIAGQPAQFSMNDAHEALRGRQLRTSELKPQRFFDPGGTQHNVHELAYWTTAFRQLRRDLVALQGLLDGSRHGAARPHIAVFPQHSTSILALAGRVLGDTAGVHVFQPHRSIPANESRWAWPSDAREPGSGKFKLTKLREPDAGEREAILILDPTATLSHVRLPDNCARGGKLALPALRISVDSPGIHCIRHPKDLQLITQVIDEAVRVLQDEWRVNRVHVFAVAPASAVVILGQKMQARHQADYVLYETIAAGADSPFEPTIELTSEVVRELVSGYGQEQSLQP